MRKTHHGPNYLFARELDAQLVTAPGRQSQNQCLRGREAFGAPAPEPQQPAVLARNHERHPWLFLLPDGHRLILVPNSDAADPERSSIRGLVRRRRVLPNHVKVAAQPGEAGQFLNHVVPERRVPAQQPLDVAKVESGQLLDALDVGPGQPLELGGTNAVHKEQLLSAALPRPGPDAPQNIQSHADAPPITSRSQNIDQTPQDLVQDGTDLSLFPVQLLPALQGYLIRPPRAEQVDLDQKKHLVPRLCHDVFDRVWNGRVVVDLKEQALLRGLEREGAHLACQTGSVEHLPSIWRCRDAAQGLDGRRRELVSQLYGMFRDRHSRTGARGRWHLVRLHLDF
ncbi:hypothetical protein AAL_03939 [Moelleriella libera RCEF 2490]|uniref:Uncharacterized protein n=1 Tax=Moelleriella libera RCEF 2490 TaxID=1081109 RepID=A0A166PH40_9HYPO|nr:hypothetical protein AAL_03939 [Moelleriella libera RCEF 2490]